MRTITRTSVCVCVAMLLFFTAAIAGDSERYVASLDRSSSATLVFLTSLRGDQLSRIAAGQDVKLAELPSEAQTRILDMMSSALTPTKYERQLAGRTDPNGLVVALDTQFTITISGGALEKTSPFTIHLGFSPDVYITVDKHRSP